MKVTLKKDQSIPIEFNEKTQFLIIKSIEVIKGNCPIWIRLWMEFPDNLRSGFHGTAITIDSPRKISLFDWLKEHYEWTKLSELYFCFQWTGEAKNCEAIIEYETLDS